MSSNPILNVSGTGAARLRTVMGLADERDPAAAERRPLRILGYAVDAGRLVLFRYDDPKMVPFPCPISVDRAADIASDWLLGADYGEEPDHDGSNEKGWRCFRDTWGRIDGMGSAAFLAVEPFWVEYGK